MKFTKKSLLKHSPCADGLAFAGTLNFDFARIYAECDRGNWLIWLALLLCGLKRTVARNGLRMFLHLNQIAAKLGPSTVSLLLKVLW